jgi:hypothetical protein
MNHTISVEEGLEARRFWAEQEAEWAELFGGFTPEQIAQIRSGEKRAEDFLDPADASFEGIVANAMFSTCRGWEET